MKCVFRIAAHELRQILREPKFLLPFLFPPVLLAISQLLFLSGTDNSAIVSGQMLLCALLVGPMAIPLASDSFAGERERGSLELLLLLPVKPSLLFFGKLIALLPVPVFFIFAVECAYASLLPEFHFPFLWKSILAGILSSVFFSGIALLISLHTKTARAANQISLLAVFPVIFLALRFAPLYFASAWLPLFLAMGVLLIFSAISAVALRRFRQL